MADFADSRIMKELKIVIQSGVEGISLMPADGTRLDELEGTVCGPKDTPYEGGSYKLKFSIPKTYPFDAPKVSFVTKVWHPNISSVTGAICLDILGKKWSASLTLQTVLLSVQCLMASPDPGNPQDAVVGTQAINNPDVFQKTATYWAQHYANAPGMRDEKMEKKVRKVTELGFTREDAIKTLSSNGWRLDSTMDKLFGETAEENDGGVDGMHGEIEEVME